MAPKENYVGVSGPDEQYQKNLQEGAFKLQHCRDCEENIFFPRYCCPSCGSVNLVWRKASGEGVVYSTTVSRRRSERGGNFNISLIELKEGPRLLSQVENIDPQAVTIGMAVQAQIVGNVNSGFRLVFKPVEASDID